MREGRKVRSDKKRSVAPTIESDLYETIAQIAYICSVPIKTVGELITIHTLNSREQIEAMSHYFRRNLTFGNSIYIGDPKRPPYVYGYELIDTRRVYLRHIQNVHDRLAAVAYALDCTISTANACVLHQGSRTRSTILDIIIHHSEVRIDSRRRDQLRDLLKRMNAVNENPVDRISLRMLVNLVVDECMEKNKTLEQAMNEYLG